MVNHHCKDSLTWQKSNDPEPVEGPVSSHWKVYIAQSIKTKRYYTGISPNPQKRLKAHNSGQGSKFAIDQGPMSLVYISSDFQNKSEARKREIQIKRWRSEKKQWLINGTIE